MDLVEREEALRTLRERLVEAASGGQVVLVAGEAGVGKTSVLRALAAGHEQLWWGACDALQTPHPLAPLFDIARRSGARFAPRLDGPRLALFEAVLDELRLAAQPMLVVIEDAHWADESTLDLIKFLGRRIERTRAMLAISYRDDEVAASHPLRSVIGELPSSALTRVELARLTPAGVETLAQRALRSPTGLFAATQGNPFFVTELLRHRVDELPHTVQALVLARFARLHKPAQAIVRLAAIVPARIERWLVDALLTPSLPDLEACLDSGLLLADASTLHFRHELARVAVESSLTPLVAQTLHAQLLHAITTGGRSLPPARLVHHAALAADAAAVHRYAPTAADDARRRGAHREAAAHWRTALHQASTAGEAERQVWLEAYAVECQITDQLAEAIAARQTLGQSLQRSGETARQAQNLSRSALVYVLALRNADADAASRRAIELVEGLPAGPERAFAYWVEAQLRMLNRDSSQSAEWSRKAIALAEHFGDRQTQVAAIGTLGAAMLFIDYEAACVHLEQALQMALAGGLHWVAANTMTNLGSGSGELFQLAAADRWLRETVAFASLHQIDFYLHYATAWLGLCDLYAGRWDEAAGHAGDAARRAGPATTSRIMALVALGRLRVRRGSPDADDTLNQALALAQATGTLQRLGPVHAARAEAAFARGDLAGATEEARAALPLALEHSHPWFIGELAFWCWRAGTLESAPPGCAEPYALQIRGQWREAAAAWAALGCPYERARALADGDVDAQRAALAIYEHLGAQPACEALRRRLREAGVRGIARGVRPSTRERQYSLTTRELQVLRLLCDGLRNAEIADRLSRSVRTVDHHLAAVFSKLGVDSRIAAIQAAQRAGLDAQSGQPRPPK